jgi:putative two-component system response regulator
VSTAYFNTAWHTFFRLLTFNILARCNYLPRDRIKMKRDISTPVELNNFREANILIFGDKPLNIELLLEQLQEEGFKNLSGETSSQKALKLCFGDSKQEDMPFDLILLDIIMPDIDRFGVIEQIRYRYIANPILAITSIQCQDTRNRALDLGVSEVVSRPFDIQELVLRIEIHLRAFFNTKRLSTHNKSLDALVHMRTSKLEQANSQLVANYHDIIWCMAGIAEFRENETGMHIKRIANYSMLLAKATGMNTYDAEEYLHTAPLHDVGKVDTPDNILLKPASLNPTEWIRMRHHAEAGWIILKRHTSELMQHAALIAHTHHEKWNGTGYPIKLKGEDIPLCGRIVSIADVFDALTSRRPYKNPWPLGNVLEFLEKERGQHFEPQLVEQFIKIIPKINKIREQFAG